MTCPVEQSLNRHLAECEAESTLRELCDEMADEIEDDWPHWDQLIESLDSPNPHVVTRAERCRDKVHESATMLAENKLTDRITCQQCGRSVFWNHGECCYCGNCWPTWLT